MTPERRQQVNRVLHEALGRPPAERPTFLARACAGDDPLRAVVESLLAHDEAASREGFLAGPCPFNARTQLELPPAAPSLLGRRLGPYEVKRLIGGGGMGEVYLAARVDDFRQEVAIKVVRPDLLGPEMLRRFRAEMQALAAADHPNVVRILDAGRTEEGRPYLVMEYVPGQPLTAHCTHQELTDRERVELLLPVCAAVQHAHERGVVHRDLKPGNVLVTAAGVAKVTDFGLAKFLGSAGGVSAATSPTRPGAVLGTPGYMAPEQAGGRADEVGPACDVYALGAILYELLAGRPPFQSDDLFKALVQVRSEEPVPPRRLRPGVPRDLETVCLKCLEKDPARRYWSARDLADDLGRFLGDAPVRARRADRVERTLRWCRRNPIVACLSAALVLVFLAGFAGVFWQWRRAEANAAAAPIPPPSVGRKDTPDAVEVGEIHRLEGHGDWVDAVAWSPDGKYLLSGGGSERDGSDFALRLWDAASGKEVRQLIGHTRRVKSVAFSPDSRHALSGGWDRVVRLWDVQSGKEVRRFSGHTSAVYCVAFSPDGEHALSCGSRLETKGPRWMNVPDERPLRLWEVATGKEVPFATANPPKTGALCAAFSPDGRQIVTGLYDTTVRLYDRATGKERLCLRGHVYGVDSIAFSPDRRHVLSTTANWNLPKHPEADVILWDLWTGREVRRFGKHRPGAYVCVAFSPDGRHALTGWRQCLRCWEVATGRQTARFEGHDGTISSVAFSPNGRRAVTASHDRTVRVWQLPPEGTRPGQLRGGPARPEVNGLLAELFQGANFEKKVKTRIDPEVDFDWQEESPDPALPAGPFSVRWTGWLLAPRPGRYHLGVSGSAGLRLWLDGSLLIDGWKAPQDRHHEVRVKLSDQPHALRIDCSQPGGNASVSLRWRLEGWPEESPVPSWALLHGQGGEIRRLQRHGDTVEAVAWSRDGKYLLSGGGQTFTKDGGRDGSDFDLRLWDAATGTEIRRFQGHTRTVLWLAFSPDSKQALSGGLDRVVRLWDVATGKELRRFEGHTSRIQTVAFSPDGKQVLSCGYGKVLRGGTHVAAPDSRLLRLWDVATGKEVPSTLIVPAGCTVHRGTFSPNGEVVAGLSDGTVRLWDPATGKERACLRGHRTGINAIAVSPDGHYLLSGSSAEGVPGNLEVSVRLWDLRTRQEVRRFRAPMDHPYVYCLAFSPDGRRALSGGWDRFLHCWEVATGREVGRLAGAGWDITAVAFSPDGRRAVTGSGDRVVRVWKLPR